MRGKYLSLALSWSFAFVLTGTAGRQQLMKPGELEKLPARPPDATLSYGRDPLQIGELRVPASHGPHPLAILIHGGCWRADVASLRDLAAMGDALKNAGIASWNIEYRRLGQPGSGWPGTYLDVGHAIDYVRVIANAHKLDLTKVVVIGHSAGGHLAMWATTRSKIPGQSPLFLANPLTIRGVVNLAGTIDMSQNIEHMAEECRAPVVERMLGGAPDSVRSRY